jgi:hypothetical protein
MAGYGSRHLSDLPAPRFLSLKLQLLLRITDTITSLQDNAQVQDPCYLRLPLQAFLKLYKSIETKSLLSLY